MKHLKISLPTLLILLILLIKTPIQTQASMEDYVFHESIQANSSFSWKFTVLNYQVPDKWSTGDPPYEKGDKITLSLKDNPSNFPDSVGFYFYSPEINLLFDFYHNDERMTEEEFLWFSSVFGKTPFPFLPLRFVNATQSYDFLESYYLNLQELEGVETGTIIENDLFYNYTTEIDVQNRTSALFIHETIIENYILNNSFSYYLLHWTYFTEIKIDTLTGLVENIELKVDRYDKEYNYEKMVDRSSEAFINYVLKLSQRNYFALILPFPVVILLVLVIVLVIKGKKKTE